MLLVFCTQRSLYDVLLGCCEESWSGEVKVQTPDKEVEVFILERERLFLQLLVLNAWGMLFIAGILTLEELTKVQLL